MIGGRVYEIRKLHKDIPWMDLYVNAKKFGLYHPGQRSHHIFNKRRGRIISFLKGNNSSSNVKNWFGFLRQRLNLEI